MHKVILFSIAMFCGAAHAAQSTDESMCLALGEMGEVMAKGLESRSEAQLLEFLENRQGRLAAKPKNKENREIQQESSAMQKLVLSYVATMQLDRSDARKMVYLKCKVGDFN